MEQVTVLLDTHTLLWWLFDAAELSPTARQLLGNPQCRVLVSAATAWEIATKVRLGRLSDAAPLVRDFSGWMAKARFVELPVTSAHACAAELAYTRQQLYNLRQSLWTMFEILNGKIDGK